MLLDDSAQPEIELMSRHPGAQAADGVGHDSARGEMAIAERIQHGGVGAQKPLQHMPMAVNTATSLPVIQPLPMKGGTSDMAAPTAPAR